jgi:hypothetical protein
MEVEVEDDESDKVFLSAQQIIVKVQESKLNYASSNLSSWLPTYLIDFDQTCKKLP